ncbi:Chloroperoxidase [Globisporangium polare]
MVSATQLVVAAAAAIATTFSVPVEGFGEGLYFRPVGSLVVSGVPGATTPFRRSPCPGLNSLANHGYLPRNGQNITKAVLKNALVTVYNLDPALADVLIAGQVPSDPFNLDILSTHDVTEHDVSLVHADKYFSKQPADVSIPMVVDFLSRGNAEGRIGFPEVGATRKDRLASCKANNPECAISAGQTRTALGESAALIGVMGGMKNESVSVAHALSFLVLEMIPLDYTKAAAPITLVDLGTYSAKIAAYTV